jgi:ADP-ribose pyrophosphatase YjhB (NUDIX family)
VVREFKEETGLDVKLDSLVAIDSLCDSFPGWKPVHSIRIIYSVQYVSGELQYEKDGSTDLCAWHTNAETQTLPLVALAEYGVKLSFG